MKGEIIELFERLMPKHFQYHKDEIIKIIDYMIDREKDDSYWCIQDYSEDVRMKFCNSIAVGIINDIVDKKDNQYRDMHLQHRDPKDDYDKGVLSCLGMIYHTQHCMNPG